MKSTVSEAMQRRFIIQDAMPKDGLFEGKKWLISPDAFSLDQKTVDDLTFLGKAVHRFNQACSQLYLESAAGRQPKWISELLDKGKPPALVEFSRKPQFANEVPSVLRPDVILTPEGFAITELDSIPGGIGVTAWMNQTYSQFDKTIIGSESGMIDNFARLLGGGDVVISKEGQSYRPEMEWITQEIRKKQGDVGNRVISTADYDFQNPGKRAYRYFELWDMQNVEHAEEYMHLAETGQTWFTPPFRPVFEEKLWLVLFWNIPLQDFWLKTLGEEIVNFLRECFPYGWVVDPTPIPYFGEIPRLKINSWAELGNFSQKQRQLALKISGFSDEAWGSHGVYIGHDLPSDEWKNAITTACDGFDLHPYILQEFRKGKVITHPYFDRDTGEIKEMEGRVRLCPYYFVDKNEAHLSGVMATICPSNKKLIHGMKDAIITPCCHE